jgi:hypothetical protein
MNVRLLYGLVATGLLALLVVGCDPGPIAVFLEQFAQGEAVLASDVLFSPISPLPTPTVSATATASPTATSTSTLVPSITPRPKPTNTTTPPIGRTPLAPPAVHTPTPPPKAEHPPSFLTGGGWFLSPEGALVTEPAFSGKVSLSFVAHVKQDAGSPSGNVEFRIGADKFTFHSTAIEWLDVVGSRASLRGVGMVRYAGHRGSGAKGSGLHGFLVSAVDGSSGSASGVDLVRIKIWDQGRGDAVVYDSQIGEADGAGPTTEMGGGGIVIHALKNKGP